MKKSSRIFLCLFLCIQSAVMAQTYSYPIDSLIQLIDSASYISHFEPLKTAKGCNRKVVEAPVQSADHDSCRNYISRKLQNYLGTENVFEHHFESDNYQGLTNIVGMKYGNNPSAGTWVISAHYDSNNNLERKSKDQGISPGANDNGTGVAAMLEMARIVGNIATEASVLFAAWDFEEAFTNGFPTGSNAWFKQHVRREKKKNSVKKFRVIKKNLKGNLNFDMFGNPQDSIDGKPLLWVCYAKKPHDEFVDSYVDALQRYVPAIAAINHGRLILSDHYTFAMAGIPALENLESGYGDDPFYHTHDDYYTNPENIDFQFATHVTQGGLAFLLENILEKHIKKEEQ